MSYEEGLLGDDQFLRSFEIEKISGDLYDNKKISVKQLIVGYNDEKTGRACGSVTMVTIDSFKVVVDCGLPTTNFGRDCLEVLFPEDVNCVVITHWHSDHVGRIHEFKHARRILPDDLVEHTSFFDCSAAKYHGHGIDKAYFDYHLELLELGGHSCKDIVLVVRPSLSTDELIVIAGDLFENAEDYKAVEVAYDAYDRKKLIESRNVIYNLNPSIVIPGHGLAFRLRSATSLNEERHFGQVIVRPLVLKTPSYDQVWILSVKDKHVLINTNEKDVSEDIKNGKNVLEAIVVLRPSARSACALGMFKTKMIYMAEDVLHCPDTYTRLNKAEWIISKAVRVNKGLRPMSLKVEIFDEGEGRILHVIGS